MIHLPSQDPFSPPLSESSWAGLWLLRKNKSVIIMSKMKRSPT